MGLDLITAVEMAIRDMDLGQITKIKWRVSEDMRHIVGMDHKGIRHQGFHSKVSVHHLTCQEAAMDMV